jgi:hypothetical protein
MTDLCPAMPVPDHSPPEAGYDFDTLLEPSFRDS